MTSHSFFTGISPLLNHQKKWPKYEQFLLFNSRFRGSNRLLFDPCEIRCFWSPVQNRRLCSFVRQQGWSFPQPQVTFPFPLFDLHCFHVLCWVDLGFDLKLPMGFWIFIYLFGCNSSDWSMCLDFKSIDAVKHAFKNP